MKSIVFAENLGNVLDEHRHGAFLSASHSIRRPLDRWRRIVKFVPSRMGENQRARALGSVLISQSSCFPFIPQRRVDVTLPYNASAIVS